MGHFLECTARGHRYGPSITLLRCDECESPLTVGYDESPDGERPRLPLETPVAMGQGDTPLIDLRGLAEELGIGRLAVKLEFMGPTGSFKDRGSAVLIGMAAASGVTEFVEDSSGNAGASLAAYAAAAGMTAHIFCPATAGRGKKDQIRIFGAVLNEIAGPRQAATNSALEYVRERNIPWLSHNMSPYFAEGMKSFAYEIAEALPDTPDHVLFPVGNGSLITGAHRGFLELLESGSIARLPALHCVQTERVQPIVAAINNATWAPPADPSTVASGIAVVSPPRLSEVVNAVRATGGSGVAVTEESILAWQHRLAATEGIFGEATSAAAFAGLEMLIGAGSIEPGDVVVVPVTGSGLKEPLVPA